MRSAAQVRSLRNHILRQDHPAHTGRRGPRAVSKQPRLMGPRSISPEILTATAAQVLCRPPRRGCAARSARPMLARVHWRQGLFSMTFVWRRNEKGSMYIGAVLA